MEIQFDCKDFSFYAGTITANVREHEIMRNISISDFVKYHGDYDILEYIGCDRVKEHFDLKDNEE